MRPAPGDPAGASASAVPRKASPWGNRLRDAMYPLVTLGILLAAWQAAAMSGAWPSYQFPAPSDVWRALVDLYGRGDLMRHLRATLRVLFLGFLLSLAIGLLVGFAMARFVPVRKGLKPFLLGLQSLPSLAWIPLAVLWYGYEEEALVFVTVIGSLFAAALMFTDAMASVPPRQILAARNMGARGVALVATVAVPAAMPAILSGLKQCWSLAWRSLIGAEIILAAVGLGFLLHQARDFLVISEVFAVMVLTLFVGLLFEVLVFSTLERWVRRRYGLGT